MDADLQVKLSREIDNMLWNMTRQLYPVCNLLLQLDYDLYKQHEIQDQFRRIHNLHATLADSVKQIRDEMVKRREDSYKPEVSCD